MVAYKFEELLQVATKFEVGDARRAPRWHSEPVSRTSRILADLIYIDAELKLRRCLECAWSTSIGLCSICLCILNYMWELLTHIVILN